MSVSTVYDIVTRFSSERTGVQGTVNAARGVETALHRVERQAKQTTLATTAALTPLARVGRAFGPMLALGRNMLGPLAAFSAVGSVGVGIARTFSNLNAEMNTSLALGAQFNTVFRFSADPIQNMATSLAVGNRFMRQMAQDAARLPGSFADFQSAMSVTGLPILAAGGNLEDVRRTLGNLAIVAPMAGQTMDTGGRQTMRMLSGQTSIGDNPLFATIRAAGLLPDAKEFNAMAPLDRFRKLDTALSRLAENPMFRRQLVRTFDTQLGALSDNLFGIEGILGRLGRGPFNSVLDGLVALNEGFDRHGDAFVGKVRAFASELSKLGDFIPTAVADQTTSLLGRIWNVGIVANLKADAKRIGALWDVTLGSEWMRAGVNMFAMRPPADDPYFATKSAYQLALEEMQRRDSLRAGLPPMIEGINRAVLDAAMDRQTQTGRKPEEPATAKTVTQIDKIEIRVDVKTDASPEAIAVAIRRDLQKQMTRPTMGKGGPRTLVPGIGSSNTP